MTLCCLFLLSAGLVYSQGMGMPADVRTWDTVRTEGRWVWPVRSTGGMERGREKAAGVLLQFSKQA